MPNLIVGLSLALVSVDAWAITSMASCVIEGYTELPLGCTAASRQINCGTTGGVYVDCTACSSGYNLESQTVTVNALESYTYGTCQRTVVIVECPSECTSTSWTSAGTGKQVRCVKNITSALCQYRCAANYYGNGTTCTACPRYNGVSGTCAAGSTSVSSCCIASGTSISFSDTKGSGTEKLTAQCCAS
ncbi:MAG: hypothetical protein J6L47_00775 [Alphaproteobacteria bacterium]|nr:hypothetical protein [Alphaproteobacteria bacterium]